MSYPWTKIPNNLESIFGEDHLCNLLFRELFYRANRETKIWTDKRGKSTELHRGQVVFGRRLWGLYLDHDAKTIERALQKLEKVYRRVTLTVTHNFTLVSINNYDSYIGNDPASDPAVTQQRPSSDPAVTTSKKDKREEKEKKEEKNARAPFPLTGELRARCLEILGSETELVRFESYWTEPSASGKQAWQFKKTFEVTRRATTWRDRNVPPPGSARPPRSDAPVSSQDRPRYVVGLPGAFTFPQIREMIEEGKVRIENDYNGKTTYILNTPQNA